MFLDTNVFFDYVLKREGHYEDAYSLIALINAKRLTCITNPNNFQHVFFLLSNHIGSRDAKHYLSVLRKIIGCATYDANTVDRALARSVPTDLEDGITLELALATGSDVLITRDERGFVSGSIEAMNARAFVDNFFVR